MFALLLLAVLAGAAVHISRLEPRTRAGAGELLLRWVLVGYCGVPMVAVSVLVLARPDAAAGVLGFPPGNPFEIFLGWAYLGMSVTGILAARYGGRYLVGPAVSWSVFFAGATAIHLGGAHGGGASPHYVLTIFASHGLVSVALVVGLLASGLLAKR